jgi:hypothetical protein
VIAAHRKNSVVCVSFEHFTNFYFCFSRDTNCRFHWPEEPLESSQDVTSDVVR